MVGYKIVVRDSDKRSNFTRVYHLDSDEKSAVDRYSEVHLIARSLFKSDYMHYLITKELSTYPEERADLMLSFLSKLDGLETTYPDDEPASDEMPDEPKEREEEVKEVKDPIELHVDGRIFTTTRNLSDEDIKIVKTFQNTIKKFELITTLKRHSCFSDVTLLDADCPKMTVKYTPENKLMTYVLPILAYVMGYATFKYLS